MKKKILQILIILLSVTLVAMMTLTVLSLLNPIFFWIPAGLSAIFAFKVLPKIRQNQ